MLFSSTAERVLKAYKKDYKEYPEYIVQAPGRVNLIGEHTDYNDGYVLPLAIDKCVNIALSAISEPEIRLYSLDFRQSITVSLEKPMLKYD